MSSVRVLVVDDYKPFTRFVCSMLARRPELQIVGEVSDGLEAVRKTEELKPDLILLDIGLSTLNGIEGARRIRKVAPESKILFISQEFSADVVREALGTGARGYVVKADVGSELLEAVNAILRGEQFVGRRFSGHDFVEASRAKTPDSIRPDEVLTSRNVKSVRRHEVYFYSDDALLLDNLTPFIGAALKEVNAAIVVTTESHRYSLLARLGADALDMGAAIEQGRYIALDAADALSTSMVNGVPDPDRFLKLLSNLIMTSAEAATGRQARVAVFRECVHLLWAQGNAEAAIQVEKLGSQLAKTYDVDILCGYSLGSFQDGMGSRVFERICAEHTAVHSR